MLRSWRQWLFPVACLNCGASGAALCVRCLPSPADVIDEHVSGVPLSSAAPYAGTWRDAIVALKRGERDYLDPMAAVLARFIAPGAALVPLPTTARRRDARGFDQSVELAKRAASLARARSYSVLAKRGSAQHGGDRAARLGAEGRFLIVTPSVPPDVIVVDDVCTTGATLVDGIATLRAAGVTVHGALVLARAVDGRNLDTLYAVRSVGPTVHEEG